MSLQVSAVPTASIKNATPKSNRPSANYHPTIWADYFLNYTSNLKSIDTTVQQQFEEIKQEVRMMLTDTKDKPSQKLGLIDAVQRLGVAYHFTSEIENELQKMCLHCNEKNDLNTVALYFRLLRQQGINASCEAFEKFKDSEGNFKASLIHDVSGMLSLYEASHLGIRGEDILDEALAFTAINLQSVLTHVSPNLAEQISHALNRPIRKCPPRLDARHYITAYSKEESHNRTLLQFAKLDFTILQQLHQEELNDIMKWWKSLDVVTKLPYARDRIVECYFWVMGVYFEPQYSLARRILTKVVAICSIVDDTYDNYGIYEELKVLTEAIQRWDIKNSDVLPECMKMIHGILVNTYNEIEEEVTKEGRSYCIYYAKEVMKRTVQSQLVEAKWRTESYVPTIEEYMDVSLVSCFYLTLSTASFLGMGAIATKEAFEWVSNDPKIVKASSVICRLMDDIVTKEFEQQRDHVASAVECYMKQNGISEEEVVKLFRKEIKDAWKDINEECLKPTVVPMPLLERVLNLARAIDVIYKDSDGYTNSHILKDYIASLLKDPVLF